MDKIIETALLYISSLLLVNAVAVDREHTDFHFPSPYDTEKEMNILRQLIDSGSDNLICYVQDRMLLCYCLIFTCQKLILVGPYRIGPIRRRDLPQTLLSDSTQWENYRNYYNALPLVEDKQIKLCAHMLFISLFGTNISTESTINVREYDMDTIPTINETGIPLSDSDELYDKDEGFFYMAQVRSGNYAGALTAYRKLMKSRGRSFVLVKVIEGLSVMRALTRLSLRDAGVPEQSTAELFQTYKLNGRRVTSIDQAIQLSEKLIEESCKLVVNQKSGQYAKPIQAAIQYIHKHLGEEISMDDLAAYSRLSSNRLSTRFKEDVGIPVSAYIARERMRTAAELLVYTNMEIQHISSTVGILDANYFSRCFRREFGVSPSVYRKNGIIPSFAHPAPCGSPPSSPESGCTSS